MKLIGWFCSSTNLYFILSFNDNFSKPDFIALNPAKNAVLPPWDFLNLWFISVKGISVLFLAATIFPLSSYPTNKLYPSTFSVALIFPFKKSSKNLIKVKYKNCCRKNF